MTPPAPFRIHGPPRRPSHVLRWPLAVALAIVGSPVFAHGGTIDVGTGAKGPVHLTGQQVQTLGVRTATAGPRPMAELLYLNGQVRLAPSGQSDASTRISGQVTALYVQVGDTVKAGQRLARVQSRLVGDPPPSTDVLAPRGGVIEAVNVHVGQSVEPSTSLMSLGDLADAAVVARVYEEDLGKVQPGQVVWVTTIAYPDQRFEGRIDRLGPVLDPDSRTVEVWVHLLRADSRLRPNLFARAGIVLRENTAALAVPAAAVIEANGERFVFVRQKDTFARVEVKTGASDGQYTQVTDGLVPGDEVVTQGNREIYTQWLTGGVIQQEDD